jgi:hypothetical protein
LSVSQFEASSLAHTSTVIFLKDVSALFENLGLAAVTMPKDAYLQSIAIHPIKSCHRIDVQECAVGSMGLEGDRRFMCVNGDNNKLITQR